MDANAADTLRAVRSPHGLGARVRDSGERRPPPARGTTRREGALMPRNQHSWRSAVLPHGVDVALPRGGTRSGRFRGSRAHALSHSGVRSDDATVVAITHGNQAVPIATAAVPVLTRRNGTIERGRSGVRDARAATVLPLATRAEDPLEGRRHGGVPSATAALGISPPGWYEPGAR